MGVTKAFSSRQTKELLIFTLNISGFTILPVYLEHTLCIKKNFYHQKPWPIVLNLHICECEKNQHEQWGIVLKQTRENSRPEM